MKISFSTNKKNDATVENNVKLPYAAPKRVFPKIRWTLILFFVASPFVFFLGKLLLDWLFVTSPGTIWMEKKTINSVEAGTIEKVFYRTGEMADPDTILFRVKRKTPENRMEQIALLEAERDAAKMGERNETVSMAINDKVSFDELQLTQQSIAYYQQIRDNTKKLMDQGAATRAEVDVAEEKLRGAKASLAAKSVAPAVNNSVSSVNPVRIMQVEQSINFLKKMTEEYFDIKSGQGGRISSILVNDGQTFSAGEPLAVVMNTQQVHIVTYVNPNDLKNISVGTVATVKVLGTGRKIKAVIEQLPLTADNVPNGISEKFHPITMRGIQIFLKVLEPLQEGEAIEGLPVVVEW